MSLECRQCERDLRSGHEPGCRLQPFAARHPYTVKVAHTDTPYSAHFSNLPLACETALSRDGAVITPSGSVLGLVDCRVELANHKANHPPLSPYALEVPRAR